MAIDESVAEGFKGAGIFDSYATLVDAATNGADNDAASIGVASAVVGLDTLGMVLDPFGTLASAGVGWLLEHVPPLPQLLDVLAGDGDAVEATGNTLREEGARLRLQGEEHGTALAALQDWTGEAADIFRTRMQEVREQIDAMGAIVDGAGELSIKMGLVVAATRAFVRDIIATVVGGLIGGAIAAVAAAPFTFGASIAAFIGAAVGTIAATAAKIASFISKVTSLVARNAGRLADLGRYMDELADMFRRISNAANGPIKPDKPFTNLFDDIRNSAKPPTANNVTAPPPSSVTPPPATSAPPTANTVNTPTPSSNAAPAAPSAPPTANNVTNPAPSPAPTPPSSSVTPPPAVTNNAATPAPPTPTPTPPASSVTPPPAVSNAPASTGGQGAPNPGGTTRATPPPPINTNVPRPGNTTPSPTPSGGTPFHTPPQSPSGSPVSPPGTPFQTPPQSPSGIPQTPSGNTTPSGSTPSGSTPNPPAGSANPPANAANPPGTPAAPPSGNTPSPDLPPPPNKPADWSAWGPNNGNLTHDQLMEPLTQWPRNQVYKGLEWMFPNHADEAFRALEGVKNFTDPAGKVVINGQEYPLGLLGGGLKHFMASYGGVEDTLAGSQEDAETAAAEPRA